RRRVAQALFLFGVQLQAGEIEHHGAGSHFFARSLRFFPSATTNAQAIPISSVIDRWTRSIPRLFKSAARGRTKWNSGCPVRSLTTQTLCQFTGKRIPVRSAFENASFAAKRLAM